MRLRIIKLGGSLLDWGPLDARLQRWLDSESMKDGRPTKNIVVVGGGALVELIRRRDRRQSLGEARCHWLAIAAMRATGRCVAQRWSDAIYASDLFEAARSDTDRRIVLDVGPFLRDVESTCAGRRLSQTWDVTSDSIAARIAHVVAADELVLLKSTLPTGCGDWHAAARAGVVDRAFPDAVAGVRTARCVDLRQPFAPTWCPAEIAAKCQIVSAMPA